MPALRWLLMLSTMATTILSQGVASGQRINNVKDCEEGEVCTDKENCPEYLKYLELKNMPDQSKRLSKMIKILIGKVCNKDPNRLCCKVKITIPTTPRPTTPRPRPPSYLPGVGQCGVSFSAKSIIHGKVAILGEFP